MMPDQEFALRTPEFRRRATRAASPTGWRATCGRSAHGDFPRHPERGKRVPASRGRGEVRIDLGRRSGCPAVSSERPSRFAGSATRTCVSPLWLVVDSSLPSRRRCRLQRAARRRPPLSHTRHAALPPSSRSASSARDTSPRRPRRARTRSSAPSLAPPRGARPARLRRRRLLQRLRRHLADEPDRRLRRATDRALRPALDTTAAARHHAQADAHLPSRSDARALARRAAACSAARRTLSQCVQPVVARRGARRARGVAPPGGVGSTTRCTACTPAPRAATCSDWMS